MKKCIIKVSVQLEYPFWVAVFERNDENGYAVARHIFGAEPTDPELYNFVSTHFYILKFTEPNNNIKLIIKRKKFKRVMRDVRKEMSKRTNKKAESFSQQILREELEKNKELSKTLSKAAKEAKRQEKFLQNQLKKKQKHRGH